MRPFVWSSTSKFQVRLRELVGMVMVRRKYKGVCVFVYVCVCM